MENDFGIIRDGWDGYTQQDGEEGIEGWDD